MEHLSTWKETEGGKVLTMGKDAIQQGETINSEVELRDRLIDLVSVGNLKHKPEALFTLFRQFHSLGYAVQQRHQLSVYVSDRGKKHQRSVRVFFFNRWLHRISRILAVLGYEGIKKATPVVLKKHPKNHLGC